MGLLYIGWSHPIWDGATLYGVKPPYMAWGCSIWDDAALYGMGLPYIV